MSFTGQIYPDDTVGYFRIASPTGRQPIEPISVGDFLIGSASQCHLRFGDADLPEIHTTLNVSRDTVMLQATTTEPPILVNGVVETECRLADGDMLEIGSHRMLFRLAAAEQRITLDEKEFSQAPAAQETDLVQDVSDVEELVNRLEEQLNLVEELTHSPDEAMVDLLKAVTEAGNSNGTDSVVQLSELQQVEKLIRDQQEATRIRFESLTTVLNNVVNQQKLIADTLAVLSDRVQAVGASKEFPQRRASA